MNPLIQQSLSDLLAHPEYSSAHLMQLRTEIQAHQKTRDSLEFFLFTRANMLRKQASQTTNQQLQSALNSQADALIDVLALLFGNLDNVTRYAEKMAKV